MYKRIKVISFLLEKLTQLIRQIWNGYTMMYQSVNAHDYNFNVLYESDSDFSFEINYAKKRQLFQTVLIFWLLVLFVLAALFLEALSYFHTSANRVIIMWLSQRKCCHSSTAKFYFVMHQNYY